MRHLAMTLLLVLVLGALTGCRFSLGHQRLLVRPGNAVPARAFENGDGEIVVCEEMAPSGTTLFVFIGGRIQERSTETSRTVVNRTLDMSIEDE